MNLKIPLQIGLYVHLPWCVKKCPYCDFNSHALKHELDEQAYVNALMNDLAFELERLGEKRTISSVFIGGGTPSLFSGKAIEMLIDGISQAIAFTDSVEITLEANPGTVDEARFNDYRSAGVNRLSLGIQSFNNDHLKALGRIHGSDEALSAVQAAYKANFDNLNLDLMYALPRQTPEQAYQDINQAISLEPAHISAYHLTLEPNTLFAFKPPPIPDDETTWRIQKSYWAALKQAGYDNYEISAYSQPSKACKHNKNYWDFGDYLGIGAGAHGKISKAQGIYRTLKPKHPEHYLQVFKSKPDDRQDYSKKVNVEELPLEYMMNKLRLNTGFNSDQFESATGLEFSCLSRQIESAMAKGLLSKTETGFIPSDKGKLFLDDLLQIFLVQPRQDVA